MEVAKLNSQRDTTEIQIVSAGITIAIFTFVCLRKLTLDTANHRNERLTKQKLQKARKIQAEKDEVIKKYENWFSSYGFDSSAPLRRTPQFERSYSHEPRLNYPTKGNLNMAVCFRNTKKTSFSKITPDTPASEKGRFNFEPHYIANFLKMQHCENDSVFPGSMPRTPFSPGENYKDWSLRRRDVQVMLMD